MCISLYLDIWNETDCPADWSMKIPSIAHLRGSFVVAICRSSLLLEVSNLASVALNPHALTRTVNSMI